MSEPRYVIDGWGNLWQHYNDIGYARLQVAGEGGKTLAEVVEQTGRVTAMTVADPIAILQARVADRPANAPVPEDQK